MSKTDTKKPDTRIFIPKELTTPNKYGSGISKTVHTHVANLQKLLMDWEKLKTKGTKICESISALWLYEYTDDYYPHQLQPLMEALFEALNGLRNIIEGVKIINMQLEALSKLDHTNNTVTFTWTVHQISSAVKNICKSLIDEIRLKEVITENLAHSRNENHIEMYVSAWELEAYYCGEMSAYLFSDIGLSGIS